MDASDKISTALETLKSDLNVLRSQDVCLMKQLMGINDKINRMKKKPTFNIKLGDHPTPPVVWKVYENNGPSLHAMNISSIGGSQSSIEDDWSSSDDLSCISSLSDSEDDLTPVSPWNTLRKSHRKANRYEDVLKKNIKICKQANFTSSESLNSILSECDSTALKETQV